MEHLVSTKPDPAAFAFEAAHETLAKHWPANVKRISFVRVELSLVSLHRRISVTIADILNCSNFQRTMFRTAAYNNGRDRAIYFLTNEIKSNLTPKGTNNNPRCSKFWKFEKVNVPSYY